MIYDYSHNLTIQFMIGEIHVVEDSIKRLNNSVKFGHLRTFPCPLVDLCPYKKKKCMERTLWQDLPPLPPQKVYVVNERPLIEMFHEIANEIIKDYLDYRDV